MAKKQETLYETLINTMVSTVGNATVTENTTTADVAEGFSSNNIRSIILTPDSIAVIYHVKGTMGKNYKIKTLAPGLTKSLFEEEETQIPALYALSKPFVCSNLEEIIVFTESDKNVFDGYTLPDSALDLRNLKNKHENLDSVRDLYNAYQREDLALYVKRDITAKVNTLIHGAWKDLWTHKYASSYETCKQFFQSVIKPSIANSLKRSHSNTQSEIIQEITTEFVNLVRHNETSSTADFAEDVIREFKKAVGVRTIDSRIMAQMKSCYQANSAVNANFEQSLKGYDRFVGIYVYDTKYSMHDLSSLVGKISSNPTLLIHTALENMGIDTNTFYEKHANDYYLYRAKEQSSIYGDIDLKVASHLDSIKDKMTKVSKEEVKTEKKQVVLSASYLEKAKEVDNWLYLYEVMGKVINTYHLNSLDLQTKALPEFVLGTNLKIKPIKDKTFKYLGKFESEDSSNIEEKTLEVIKLYVYSNLLKFVLENMNTLQTTHPILTKQIVKNAGAIKVSGMDNTLVQMNTGIGFEGNNLSNSVCNLASLISTYFISHSDKETNLMGVNVTSYMNKELWQKILTR